MEPESRIRKRIPNLAAAVTAANKNVLGSQFAPTANPPTNLARGP